MRQKLWVMSNQNTSHHTPNQLILDSKSPKFKIYQNNKVNR